MQTVTVDRNTQHLAFLAGELQAAKDELGRALRNGTRHEVNVARADVEAAQRDFQYEFRAVAALQELAAPVVSVPVTMQAAKKNERCPHWKLIKRFFAIAREAGLDTSKDAKPKMRHAMESVMGRCVDSRSEVRPGEWEMMGDAIKSKRLSW
jgi:hypothetical protein